MTDLDIRWKQRFSNFKKSFKQLNEFIKKENLNKLEEQGLIQCFEYNYELSWNCIKDFYESQGDTNIQGSRDAFRLGFKRGLYENGEVWMDMIKSRSLTSHTYNENIAREVVDAIKKFYFQAFKKLIDEFEKKL